MKQRSLSSFDRRKWFTTTLALCAAAVGAVAVPAAQAQVTRNERLIERPLLLPVSCPGAEQEILSGTINLHVLSTSTTNGNHISATYHSQIQRGVLIAAQTGDIYRPVSVTHETVTESTQNAVYTLTFVNGFRIIGRGPSNNIMVHLVSHVTRRPNGEVAVEFEKLSRAECR